MAGEKFSKPGAKLSELEEAASARLEDARVLAAHGRNATAIAMALYALEISLKVAICRRLDLDALPTDFQIHDFKGLLILSGLSRKIKEPANAKVESNWDFIITEYKTSHVDTLRYAPGTRYLPAHARELLRRLEETPEGVLTWLSVQT